jgi:O-antigen/teichoic acid export membrane protein
MNEKARSVGNKLATGSFFRVVTLVAAAAVSFFLMPFIVRHLGDRLYGFWSLAAAFIGYYSLLDLGLSSAVSQYLGIAIGRNDSSECRGVYNTALRINCFLALIAFLATGAIVVATPWFTHDPADVRLFREVIALLGTNMALGFPLRVYNGILDAQYRFDISSWLNLLGLALRTGLVVWAILSGGGLLALAWMTLLASLPVMVLQIWFGRREAHWARIDPGFIDWPRMKGLFAYGLHTFLAYLADIVRFQVDPLVISGLIGLAAVTHYRVAGVFVQYFLQILILSVGILQPVFSRLHGAGNREALDKVFFFGTKLSCSISVFVCLALVAWGKPFISRWMGTRYEDAYLPLVILSFAVLLDVSQKPSIDLLYATFKHRFYTYMNWVEGAINLVFSLMLARRYGIVGVATGTLIGAFIVRAIVQPWWVCRVTGLHYGAYVRFLGKNLLYSACIMGFATAIASWGLRPAYPLLIGSAVCATVTYAGGCWFLVLDKQERRQLLAAATNGGRMDVEPATAGAPL